MPDDIATEYKLPAQLMAYVDDGFLELLSEKEDEKTLRFHIPSKLVEHTRDHIMAYSLVWIHPDFNAQFCHFYHDQPGDLPNFYVERQFSDDAPQSVNDLNSVDDLIDWLEALKHAEVA